MVALLELVNVTVCSIGLASPAMIDPGSVARHRDCKWQGAWQRACQRCRSLAAWIAAAGEIDRRDLIEIRGDGDDVRINKRRPIHRDRRG